MAVDKEQEEVRKFFGGRLKDFREGASIGVSELGDSVDLGRQYINLVESGKANWTIDSYVEMLHKCGVSFWDSVAAFRNSDIPEEHQPLHRLLRKILKNGNPQLLAGVNEVLQAFAEKAVRLQKQKSPKRHSPPRDNDHHSEGPNRKDDS